MSNSSTSLRVLGFTFLGGALGSLSRGFITHFGSDPIDIFIANIVGSFILALALTVPALATPERQAFLGSGFAGGFTTLSGIAIISILGKLSPDIVVAYISLSVAFGLLAYWLGDAIGRRIKRAAK